MTTRTSRTRTARTRGFTLVELLAVMLILAVLMTLVIGASKMLFNKIYVDETKNSMKIIMTALSQYYESTGDYPTQDANNEAWISQLAGNDKARAQITKLEKKVWNADNNRQFRDAWENPIVYKRTGGLAGAPGLISPGPDGDISTEDDNVRDNK
jgi:general secretion pathway protein G